jgi:hypothetical protein
VNAKLRLLAGGKSKQDVKRGFAIIESSGMTRFFVARNSQEFSLWTKEISCTIRYCSDARVVAEMDKELLNGYSSGVALDESDNNEDTEDSRRMRGLGNRLASSRTRSLDVPKLGRSFQEWDKRQRAD